MGRKQVEALGYTFVEKDLPLIVKDWCVGDEILCLIEGQFPYSTVTAIEVGEYLKPVAIEKVLEGYRIYAGMIVVGPPSTKATKKRKSTRWKHPFVLLMLLCG